MKALALAAALFLANPVSAEEIPPRLFEPFETVCIPKKEVGFSWEQGEWVPKTYQPGKPFVIRKIVYENRKYIPPGGSCDLTVLRNTSKNSLGMSSSSGCYSVSTNPMSLLGILDECTEMKFGDISRIHCSEVTFDPNGLFIHMPTGTFLDTAKNPKDDYKDSLVMTTGECRTTGP